MSIFVSGDSHGHTGKIVQWSDSVENSTLIHVGDLCLSLYNLQNVDYRLSKRGNKMIVCEGNHESNEYEFNNQVVEKSITLASRYSIHEIEGKRVLFAGGAISLDRVRRREFKLKYPNKENWFQENEAFFYQKGNYKDIDILVTHTIHEKFVSNSNPHFPKKFAEYDPHLLADLEIERTDVLKLYDNCAEDGVKISFAGHFHSSERGEYKGMKYKVLAIDEIVELT